MNLYASGLELWRIRADAVFQSSSLILAAPAVDVYPRPSPEMLQRMLHGTSSSGTKQAESRSPASRFFVPDTAVIAGNHVKLAVLRREVRVLHVANVYQEYRPKLRRSWPTTPPTIS